MNDALGNGSIIAEPNSRFGGLPSVGASFNLVTNNHRAWAHYIIKLDFRAIID